MNSKRDRRWHLPEWFARAVRLVVWIMAGVVGLAAVLMSPFALRAIDQVTGLNWLELADVGQTYEAVAALLTVPTFGGVVISLLVQRREVHTGQEQTALLTQIELARIAIENPDLLAVDGSTSASESLGRARRDTLMNLWMSKWRSLFALGNLTERELREILSRFFRGGDAREWWRTARDSYRIGVGSRRQRRFGKIADEQYVHASSMHIGTPNTEHTVSTSLNPVRAGAVCLIAAVLGGASGWFLRRHHAR
ncbi:DUF6082 family protein [Actinoallomurus sp. NBC_01490]|uniref:DUF6082 family protein n=1 Tax=Actinoallomurus sp. NBC_01490 TaxID=2903557 RepID=UPI002E30E516|nr:DUF6082 family protein [Actinoallomurus sp. NBC_01490]